MKTIQLTITNVDTLSDGGPLTYRSSGRAFEIGRDHHRDWSLPDPRLFISGRHCDVQFDGQNYVLNDVSRNGTYLNGSQQRVKSPHRLENGDRIAIGNYVIDVLIDEQDPAQADNSPWPGASAGDEDDIWGAASAGPKPMDRREFRPKPKQSPTGPDFVKSHLHMPAAKPLELPPFDEDPYGGASSLPVFGADTEEAPQPRAAEARPALQPGRERRPAAGGGADLLAEFKLGARLPQHALASRVPGEVAQELGAMLLLVVEQMSLLLKARASAKALVRSQDRTIIGALDNNPMKFMADPGEALEAMLSKERTGYLDGMRALREAFEDIKSHEMATYSAMQKALSRLLDDLSPEAIESKVSKSAFSNSKAKAWETFVQRWEAKVEAHENGMLDVFLLYFSEAYKEASGKRRR